MKIRVQLRILYYKMISRLCLDESVTILITFRAGLFDVTQVCVSAILPILARPSALRNFFLFPKLKIHLKG